MLVLSIPCFPFPRSFHATRCERRAGKQRGGVDQRIRSRDVTERCPDLRFRCDPGEEGVEGVRVKRVPALFRGARKCERKNWRVLNLNNQREYVYFSLLRINYYCVYTSKHPLRIKYITVAFKNILEYNISRMYENASQGKSDRTVSASLRPVRREARCSAVLNARARAGPPWREI